MCNGSRLFDLKQKNEKLSRSLPKYEERVEKLETYVAGKREDIQRKSEELTLCQEQLKKLVKIRIQQLIQYIFPIAKVEAKPYVNCYNVFMDYCNI